MCESSSGASTLRSRGSCERESPVVDSGLLLTAAVVARLHLRRLVDHENMGSIQARTMECFGIQCTSILATLDYPGSCVPESPEVGNYVEECPEVQSSEVGSPEVGNPEVGTPEVGSPGADNPEMDNPEVEHPENDKQILSEDPQDHGLCCWVS